MSARARQPGADQAGTLGSGNHFLEVDRVAEVYDEAVAEAYGLLPGRVALQIHSGSRGLGYQVCDEALAELTTTMARYGPDYARLPDPQLACAPIASEAGRRYLGAMQTAANFAWANRQVMTGLSVRAVCRAMGISEGDGRGFPGLAFPNQVTAIIRFDNPGTICPQVPWQPVLPEIGRQPMGVEVVGG